MDGADNFEFAITFQNKGNAPAYNVSLTVNLPQHLYIPYPSAALCVTTGDKKSMSYTSDWGRSTTVTVSLTEPVAPTTQAYTNNIIITFSILDLYNNYNK